VKRFSRDKVGGALKVATAQAVNRARMLVNSMADCHTVVKEMYRNSSESNNSEVVERLKAAQIRNGQRGEKSPTFYKQEANRQICLQIGSSHYPTLPCMHSTLCREQPTDKS